MSTGDLRTLRAQGKIAGRAYFGLRRVGVDRLSDLVGWSLSRIEAVPGIGEAAAREILELMQAAGMTVPTTPVPGIVVRSAGAPGTCLIAASHHPCRHDAPPAYAGASPDAV
jgi:hypothetical protein